MATLDNPVWESLTSRHASLARIRGGAGRYLPEVAPLAAVDADDRDSAFLHVSNESTRAKSLYSRLGYRQRTDVPLWQVCRLADQKIAS